MSLSVALAGLVVFVSHGLEAVTGFGCTVLALPFVTMLLGIGRAKFLLAILAWALAAYIAIAKRRMIDWRQYAVIVALVGLGMPLGMLAFSTLPKGVLIKCLGVFIVVSSGLQLLKRFRKGRGDGGGKPRPWHYALLFLGGIVHGAFASGGPLVVLYAAKALPDKGRFRATLTLLWATLNTVLIADFALSGKFTAEAWLDLALMAPFLVAGIVAGEKAHDRLDPGFFTLLVFATLFVTGWIMLFV